MERDHAQPPRGRRIGTAEGTRSEAFASLDWALLTIIAAFWGATFLFVAIALDHFEPGLVTLARVLGGGIAVGVFPAARARINREDWPQLLAMSLIWIALPLELLPIAQQRIDSSFAGMLSGAVPLVAALVAAGLLRRRPGPAQSVGLLIGFGGVLAVSIPSTAGESASILGTLLMLIVMLAFGVGANLAVPLQQRYGSIPVMFHAQLIAAVVVLPFGLVGIDGSSFAWSSLLAVGALATLSGGVALVAMTTLGGRVGAPRANVAVYFVPIVAIILGVLVRDESVEPIALLGIAMVLLGAFFATRADVAQPHGAEAHSAPQ